MYQAPFYLFVYGSLRSGFHHPAYQYISDYFTLEGEATTKGELYDMGDYPAAVPSSADQYIIGELYKIKNEDEFGWAIGQLDDYEGVVTEEGEKPLYRRSRTTVIINRQQQEAWIYWYNGNVTNKPFIPGGDMLAYWNQKNKAT